MECDEEADEEKYSNSSKRRYKNHSRRHRYPLRQLHLGVGINYLLIR
jgi:hypothetical protein